MANTLYKAEVVDGYVRDAVDKIAEYQRDGWEITTMTPLEYIKIHNQDRYEASGIVLTMKRTED